MYQDITIVGLYGHCQLTQFSLNLLINVQYVSSHLECFNRINNRLRFHVVGPSKTERSHKTVVSFKVTVVKPASSVKRARWKGDMSWNGFCSLLRVWCLP